MLIIGLEGTQEIAEKLASMLVPGDCITLKGDLGAGKTTFVQTVIQALHGGDIGIISPTFNLLQTYDVELLGSPCTIWHYDLYRLEDPEELQELGFEDAFEGGISLIEWPEIAVHWIPKNAIHIEMEFTEENENRDIKIHSSDVNKERLERAGLC